MEYFLPWIQSLSCVQLFVTPWTSAHQASLSITNSQARLLEWDATDSSRGSSWPRNQTCVSYATCMAGRFFTTRATWEDWLWGHEINCVKRLNRSRHRADSSPAGFLSLLLPSSTFPYLPCMPRKLQSFPDECTNHTIKRKCLRCDMRDL